MYGVIFFQILLRILRKNVLSFSGSRIFPKVKTYAYTVKVNMAADSQLKCRQGMFENDSELYGGGISDRCWKEPPFPNALWDERVPVDGQLHTH